MLCHGSPHSSQASTVQLPQLFATTSISTSHIAWSHVFEVLTTLNHAVYAVSLAYWYVWSTFSAITPSRPSPKLIGLTKKLIGSQSVLGQIDWHVHEAARQRSPHEHHAVQGSQHSSPASAIQFPHNGSWIVIVALHVVFKLGYQGFSTLYDATYVHNVG